MYSKSETGNFSVRSFAKIYSDAIIDLNFLPVAYTGSLNANAIPERVERNAFINSLPKSYDKTKVPEADADGKIDYKDAAVKVGAAKLDKNGNLLFPNFYDICDVSELTRLGFEQYMKNKKISDMLVSGAIQIVPFSDKILYDDNDGDGIPNKDDPYPDEPFDERFEIVDDFNYEPSIDFVDRHYKRSQECYGIISEPNVLGKALAILSIATRDSDSCANILSPVLNQTDFNFGNNPERKTNSSALKHAFDAMKHYFWGTGKEVNYSELDTCELISSSIQNLTHLFDNINSIMRCAEQTLTDGISIIICPKSDQKLKSICLIKSKTDGLPIDTIDEVMCNINYDDTKLKDHEIYYCNYVHRDWNLTVGEALGTFIAEINRDGDKFTMKYKYYIKDIYEWAYHEEQDIWNVSAILHGAHEAGVAQEYLITGHFDGYLTWKLNDNVTDTNVAQQLFMTLADKEGGLKDNQSNVWLNSNEIERFKEMLSNK